MSANRHRRSKLCRLTHGQVVHISTLADSVRRCGSARPNEIWTQNRHIITWYWHHNVMPCDVTHVNLSLVCFFLLFNRCFHLFSLNFSQLFWFLSFLTFRIRKILQELQPRQHLCVHTCWPRWMCQRLRTGHRLSQQSLNSLELSIVFFHKPRVKSKIFRMWKQMKTLFSLEIILKMQFSQVFTSCPLKKQTLLDTLCISVYHLLYGPGCELCGRYVWKCCFWFDFTRSLVQFPDLTPCDTYKFKFQNFYKSLWFFMSF